MPSLKVMVLLSPTPLFLYLHNLHNVAVVKTEGLLICLYRTTTGNLTLKEIGFLFIKAEKSAVKTSIDIRNERKRTRNRQSIVIDTCIRRRMSEPRESYQEKMPGSSDEYVERV